MMTYLVRMKINKVILAELHRKITRISSFYALADLCVNKYIHLIEADVYFFCVYSGGHEDYAPFEQNLVRV